MNVKLANMVTMKTQQASDYYNNNDNISPSTEFQKKILHG